MLRIDMIPSPQSTPSHLLRIFYSRRYEVRPFQSLKRNEVSATLSPRNGLGSTSARFHSIHHEGRPLISYPSSTLTLHSTRWYKAAESMHRFGGFFLPCEKTLAHRSRVLNSPSGAPRRSWIDVYGL